MHGHNVVVVVVVVVVVFKFLHLAEIMHSYKRLLVCFLLWCPFNVLAIVLLLLKLSYMFYVKPVKFIN